MDHKAEAVTWLETIAEVMADAADSDNDKNVASAIQQTSAWTFRAQVHATLALVEEQRTANLIAFYEMDLRRGAFDAVASLKLFTEIRDRLGLS